MLADKKLIYIGSESEVGVYSTHEFDIYPGFIINFALSITWSIDLLPQINFSGFSGRREDEFLTVTNAHVLINLAAPIDFPASNKKAWSWSES